MEVKRLIPEERSTFCLYARHGMRPCLHCGTETDNPKFCSRSCAATYTNKAYPKRKPTGSCRICATPLTRRLKMCSSCREAQSRKNTTIGAFRAAERAKGRHASWLHHQVRGLNRCWNRSITKGPCRRCGYTHHVELAHIKPITEFPDDTLLGEVNSPANLIPLCPNCHWEMDNGILAITQDSSGNVTFQDNTP